MKKRHLLLICGILISTVSIFNIATGFLLFFYIPLLFLGLIYIILGTKWIGLPFDTRDELREKFENEDWFRGIAIVPGTKNPREVEIQLRVSKDCPKNLIPKSVNSIKVDVLEINEEYSPR